MKAFLDTSVVLYALGDSHPLRQICREVIALVEHQSVELCASVELVQEAVFHRMRRGSRAAAIADGNILLRMLTLYDFDTDVMRRAMELMAVCEIRGRDAIHAATALEHGFREIVTVDSDYNVVPALTAIDPAHFLQR